MFLQKNLARKGLICLCVISELEGGAGVLRSWCWGYYCHGDQPEYGTEAKTSLHPGLGVTKALFLNSSIRDISMA